MPSGPPVGYRDLSNEVLLANYVMAKRPKEGPPTREVERLETEILRRMNQPTSVGILRKHDGSISSVYGNHDAAIATAKRYNDDPFIEGEPDPDAPYTVEVWGLFDNLRQRKST